MLQPKPLPARPTSRTTPKAFEREINLGDSVIGSYSLGESITTTETEPNPQTVTVDTSSKSVSLTSTVTTSEAEPEYFVGEETLIGNKVHIGRVVDGRIDGVRV